MYKDVQFTRRELFDKVWETPLTRLARTIGVSDVALAKACRRAMIPLLGRGYWAKDKRHRSKKPVLPKLKDPYYEVVSFRIVELDGEPRPAKLEIPLEEPIPVPSALGTPHTLISKTLREAKKAKVEDGRLRLAGRMVLDIRISRDMLDRVTRLLDTLIKASEAKGYTWKIGEDGKTTVTANGQSMEVRLSERLQRRDLPPPPPRQRKSGERWEPNWNALFVPKYEWVSKGKLSFQIDEYLTDNAQKNWNDTARTKLEDKLHEIVRGFAVAALAIEAIKLQREADKRRWEEKEHQRKIEMRLVEEQRRIRQKLVQATESWERSQRIRKFCDATVQTIDSLPAEQQGAARAWIAWAIQQAEMLDPFRGDLDRLFSLQAPVEEWFSGLPAYQKSKEDWWA